MSEKIEASWPEPILVELAPNLRRYRDTLLISNGISSNGLQLASHGKCVAAVAAAKSCRPKRASTSPAPAKRDHPAAKNAKEEIGPLEPTPQKITDFAVTTALVLRLECR